MIDLFTFLHRREKRRGATVSCLIRLGLLLPLALGGLAAKPQPALNSYLAWSALAAYGLTLYLVQRNRYSPLISTLSVITDSLLLSGTLFYRNLLEPGTLSSSPLLLVYPLIIYFAFLRSDEIILLLSVVLNLVLYNSAFLITQGISLQRGADLYPDALAAQLFRTMILVIFGLALFDQSRRIRAILRNQNDYYEKVRHRNKPLFENLDELSDKYGLSKRESEVLRELIKGKTYRAIGEDLFVSLDTIKSHVKSIYKKTGLKSRSELFRKLHGEVESVGLTP